MRSCPDRRADASVGVANFFVELAAQGLGVGFAVIDSAAGCSPDVAVGEPELNEEYPVGWVEYESSGSGAEAWLHQADRTVTGPWLAGLLVVPADPSAVTIP